MIHIKKRVLVIDNDLVLCQAIYNSMQDDLTEICYMTSAVEALASYMTQDCCLVIVNAQLSDMNGMDLIQTIRNTKNTPILALTASSNVADKIKLFHLGADACIEKSLGVDVCVAQANALIQVHTNMGINDELHKPIIHGSELIISPYYRQVIVDGKCLELTRKEFDVLHCLASYPGRVFTREQIYDCVWSDGPAIAIDETVKSQIKSLRKKLASVGKHYIHTEWGVGYRFIFPN